MSRLNIYTMNSAEKSVEELYKELERRIEASPSGLCPVDITASFLKMCRAQSCGKCSPCRIGLEKLEKMIDKILDGEAEINILEDIEKTAKAIYQLADCAIGFEAARAVLNGFIGYKKEFKNHIIYKKCTCEITQSAPCVARCPAGVDIPGYIALVKERKYEDAIKLIRKDNPLPSVCALVCERPCEEKCRRRILDDAINIKALKKVAVENSEYKHEHKIASETGKKVAIVGGGAGGLSAAYYLRLMGHKVTIYEQRKKLGGMLRYGIPNYRLPREILDKEIEFILSTGIEVNLEKSIGKDYSLEDLKAENDAVYISIGAHSYKSLGILGEDAKGVIPSIYFLRDIGDEKIYDFSGKKVVVIGGGNVAMDAARSSLRMGAENVKIIYRRRVEDMTALKEEIHGAVAEGVDILTLLSPIEIVKNEDESVKGVKVQPQIVGEIVGGRPRPKDSLESPRLIECNIVVIAIGQKVELEHFKDSGIPVEKGAITPLDWSGFNSIPGVYAGGDCVTGPATVIRAIEAGKVAAANIDNYLGYNHEIKVDIDIPIPNYSDRVLCGRVNIKERDEKERVKDFDMIELSMTEEEAYQEASRCLRCDHFGLGVLKGGRLCKW